MLETSTSREHRLIFVRVGSDVNQRYRQQDYDWSKMYFTIFFNFFLLELDFSASLLMHYVIFLYQILYYLGRVVLKILKMQKT